MASDLAIQTRVARRVGSHIREARHASGLSRDRVARSSGFTSRELAAYEQGRRLPSQRDAFALAGACGIRVDELLPPDLLESLD
jgi:transcriptional regulator with XRE-family HTH domain